MSLEALKDIKSTETRAAQRLEEARHQAAERVTAAKKVAQAEVEKARTQAKTAIQQALDSAEKEVEREIGKLRDQHQLKRDDLHATGQKNMDRAMVRIMERVLG